jgi:hypothetical protein
MGICDMHCFFNCRHLSQLLLLSERKHLVFAAAHGTQATPCFCFLLALDASSRVDVSIFALRKIKDHGGVIKRHQTAVARTRRQTRPIMLQNYALRCHWKGSGNGQIICKDPPQTPPTVQLHPADHDTNQSTVASREYLDRIKLEAIKLLPYIALSRGFYRGTSWLGN